MAKRFTDTAKWDKAWFRKLDPVDKCIWMFLCDRCDHAGIWDIDEDAFEYFVGCHCTISEILEKFGDHVEVVCGNKLLVKDFVEYQYGSLNPENRVHKSVLDRLEKTKKKDRVSPLIGAKDKEEDKDKDKAKDKDKEKERDFKNWALEVYRRYPRKKGKAPGIRRLITDFKAGHSREEVEAALDRHIAQLKKDKTEKEFIPYFSTWANSWTDCLDEDHGAVEDFSNPNKLDPNDFKMPGAL